jgi:hypothetical protein
MNTVGRRMLSNSKTASKAYICAAILDLPRIYPPPPLAINTDPGPPNQIVTTRGISGGSAGEDGLLGPAVRLHRRIHGEKDGLPRELWVYGRHITVVASWKCSATLSSGRIEFYLPREWEFKVEGAPQTRCSVLP